MKLITSSLLVVHFFISRTCAEENHEKLTPLEGYFYELKPYIYTEKNKLKGLFVEYFNELKSRSCEVYESARDDPILINYRHNLGKKRIDWGPYVDIINNNIDACLFPFTSDIDLSASNGTSGNGTKDAIDVFSSEGLAVVVHRQYISFLTKLTRAMKKMDSIFILISVAIFVGLLFWIIERGENEKFKGTFMHGAGNGVWLALVTMTTVGYGDVAPKKFLSRLIAVPWMMIGLIATSFMVAIISDEFSGEFKVKPVLQNQKVAVLDGIDKRMFKEKYDTHKMELIGYKTYEDIFGAVRNGDVFAAIINSDVAAYRQDEFERGINKLAVTALINIEIPVKMMVNKHRFKPIHCDSNIHKKAVIATLAKHRKRLNIETLHYDSITNMLTCSDKGFYISMLVGILLSFGLIFDVTNQIKMLYQKSKRKTHSFLIENILMEHTKEIMDPLSFDDEIKYASKELRSIQQSLATLHSALVRHNSIENSSL